MFSNEGCDAIDLSLRRLETALAIGHDNEFVTRDFLSQTVQANVRRIAQAIRSIELIACVYENILDVKAFSEIIKRQFTFVVHQKTIWIYNTHIPTVSKSLEQMGICRH